MDYYHGYIGRYIALDYNVCELEDIMVNISPQLQTACLVFYLLTAAYNAMHGIQL